MHKYVYMHSRSHPEASKSLLIRWSSPLIRFNYVCFFRVTNIYMRVHSKKLFVKL